MVEGFNPELIGSVAGILTTVAYVPQVIKVWRHKNTTSLSLIMYIMLTTGIGLWTVYGVYIDSPSLIWANGICFIMALYILLMKIKHG